MYIYIHLYCLLLIQICVFHSFLTFRSPPFLPLSLSLRVWVSLVRLERVRDKKYDKRRRHPMRRLQRCGRGGRLMAPSVLRGPSPAVSLPIEGSGSSVCSAYAPVLRSYAHRTPACLARRIRGGRRQRHREAAPGDWLCQCGEVNYRSKRECFKCGAPAPPLPPGVRRPSLPGEDPNDWACPCGQMNFRGSVLCHKCQQPKPVPPPLPGKEVTLWTCPKCKGVNRSHRKFCFKCSTPSPLIEFKPIQ